MEQKPWKITQFADGTVGIHAPDGDKHHIEIATLRGRFATERARLIAAAPELLEMLTECRKHINLIIEDGAPTDWHMWRDDLDALIAKATA